MAVLPVRTVAEAPKAHRDFSLPCRFPTRRHSPGCRFRGWSFRAPQPDAHGSSLPPLTLVTVVFPVFRSMDLMVCEVTWPLSVLQVPVMIFLPADVTRVLCSSFMRLLLIGFSSPVYSEAPNGRSEHMLGSATNRRYRERSIPRRCATGCTGKLSWCGQSINVSTASGVAPFIFLMCNRLHIPLELPWRAFAPFLPVHSLSRVPRHLSRLICVLYLRYTSQIGIFRDFFRPRPARMPTTRRERDELVATWELRGTNQTLDRV